MQVPIIILIIYICHILDNAGVFKTAYISVHECFNACHIYIQIMYVHEPVLGRYFEKVIYYTSEGSVSYQHVIGIITRT